MSATTTRRRRRRPEPAEPVLTPTARPDCEPDPDVPLRLVSVPGPGGAWATSSYARCRRCGRDFVPNSDYPARCNGAPHR